MQMTLSCLESRNITMQGLRFGAISKKYFNTGDTFISRPPNQRGAEVLQAGNTNCI